MEESRESENKGDIALGVKTRIGNEIHIGVFFSNTFGERKTMTLF